MFDTYDHNKRKEAIKVVNQMEDPNDYKFRKNMMRQESLKVKNYLSESKRDS